MPTATNPLLKQLDAGLLPDFAALTAEDFLPALQHTIDAVEQTLAEVLQANTPSWAQVFQPLEQTLDRVDQVWAVISHINGVANTEAVREAYGQCQPLITEFSTRLGQHRGLFEACEKLVKSDAFTQLSTAQQKSLQNRLRDFRLAGIDLPEAEQQRYAAIRQRLAELNNQFSNNVLDATEAYSHVVADKTALSGLPQAAMDAAQRAAEAKSQSGYLLTLDIPSYLPMMQYCDNRALRETLYKAYVTRASEQGPNAGEFDNSPLIDEILSLRAELAALLGFENYAELSLATKMAEHSHDVTGFLDDLAARTVSIARQEFTELEAFANRELGLANLQAWDVAYAAEKLREQAFAISQEQLRPYFPADRVIEGLFEVVRRLFKVSIKAAEPPSSWHQDVRFYSVQDEQGNTLAQFYFDLFAREGKRGGAWMADCKARLRFDDGDLQLPVAFLTCNFTPPAPDLPSLLTHNEVTTLFHEFGHGLHHMLTEIETASVAGISGVAWDAVELPSQFMENWCWEKEALQFISGHYQRGGALPDDMLEKMLAARNFHSAMQMVRQLEFGLFDMRIHRDAGSQQWQGAAQTLAAVREQVAAYPAPDYNRFQHSFAHIFAGGYAAGYYSYKWAEVLSADAYSLFEEQGIFDSATGQRFRSTVLARGGSEEPAALFRQFRGRDADIAALLRHSGIALEQEQATA